MRRSKRSQKTATSSKCACCPQSTSSLAGETTVHPPPHKKGKQHDKELLTKSGSSTPSSKGLTNKSTHAARKGHQVPQTLAYTQSSHQSGLEKSAKRATVGVPMDNDQDSDSDQEHHLPQHENYGLVDDVSSESDSSSDESVEDMVHVVKNHTADLMGDRGNGPLFVEPLSTPILHTIPKTLQKRILKDKFIDFSLLLPNSNVTPPASKFTVSFDASSNLNIVPNNKHKKALSIDQWTTAFLRFVAVYSTRYPHETQHLMKYGEIVRDLAVRRPGPAWSFYDEQFRRYRENQPLPWDRLHTEFYLLASTQPVSHQPYHNRPFRSGSSRFSPYNSPKPQNRFLPNTCWTYNRRGQCRRVPCPQPHICGFCKGNHIASNCKYSSIWEAGASNAGPRTPQLKSKNTAHKPQSTSHSYSDQRIPQTSSPHGGPGHSSPRSTPMSGLNKSVSRILQKSMAPATRISYRNALKQYRRFHNTHYATSSLLPITVERLAQFIAVSNDMGLKPSTITSMTSALSYIHRINRFRNPTKSFLISKLLYSLRRTQTSDKRKGFTPELLQSLITALDDRHLSHYKQLLFRSMFLLAFFGLLRVGEIALTTTGSDNLLRMEHIQFHYQNTKVTKVGITMPFFKHSRGQPATVVIRVSKLTPFCPVRSLLEYCELNNHFPGPLFRFQCGCPVSAAYFSKILKQCVLSCKLNPNEYTSHSFRIGGATYAAKQRLSTTRIKQLGRWHSKAYLKYIRN